MYQKYIVSSLIVGNPNLYFSVKSSRPSKCRIQCIWSICSCNNNYRITSYNVCYTKLLRGADQGASRHPGVVALSVGGDARRRQRSRPARRVGGHASVITSYSIHYTKLYDSDVSVDARFRAIGDFAIRALAPCNALRSGQVGPPISAICP